MANTVSKKRKFRGNSNIILYVGQSKTPFHIHDDVLFEASPVFKAAFSSQFKEASERMMELPDEDPDVFESFIDCTYARGFENSDGVNLIKDKNLFMQIAQIYVLADKYEVEVVKVSICKQMFICLRKFNPGRCLDGPCREARTAIEYIDENTSPNTLLRTVIGDWCAYCAPWLGYMDKSRSLEEQQESKELAEWLREHPNLGAAVAFAMARGSSGEKRGRYQSYDHVLSLDLEKYMARIQEQE